jgi:hypothetical protein
VTDSTKASLDRPRPRGVLHARARNLSALRASAPLWGSHLNRLQTDPRTLARASQLLHDLVRSLPGDRRNEVAEMLHHTAPEAEKPFVSIYDHANMTGKREGKIEGKIEGRLLTARSTLKRLLERRFGSLPSSVEARIDAAEVEALEAALLRIFDVTTPEGVFEG